MRRPDVFTLDYSHPLAQGLVFGLLGKRPNGGIAEDSSLAMQKCAMSGGARFEEFDGRYALRGNGVAGSLVSCSIPIIPAATPITISFHTQVISTPVSYPRWFVGSISTGGMIFENSYTRFSLAGSFGFTNYAVNTAKSYGTSPSHFCFVYQPTSLAFYENLNPSVIANGTKLQNGGAFTLFANADGSRPLNGIISDFCIYNRALSHAEIALLADRTDPMLGGLIVEERPVLYFDMGGAGDITGTMSATESGSDSIAATGQLLISGLMSVTEAGSDTASILGVLPAQGTLSATETGHDTAATSGAVLIQGSLSVTEQGADVFAAWGGAIAPITGTMAVTESGADTATIIGQLLVSGLMSVSEVGADVFEALGSSLPAIMGDMSVSETGVDIFAAMGLVTDTTPISPDEVARIVRATPRMKTVTASARVKQVRYEVTRA